jgi:cytochrome c peroxidase
VELLGKALMYDAQLSVNRNEACAFCHTPETGFTGQISQLNQTTGAYPGSVRTRFSDRKPQTHREMGLVDPACEVYRASQRPYRQLFEQIWGKQPFAIAWPTDVETIAISPDLRRPTTLAGYI